MPVCFRRCLCGASAAAAAAADASGAAVTCLLLSSRLYTVRMEEARPCTPTCCCAFELLLPCNPCHVRSWLQAVYTVRLEGETLHTLLEVTNTGDKPFDFTASLHR